MSSADLVAGCRSNFLLTLLGEESSHIVNAHYVEMDWFSDRV